MARNEFDRAGMYGGYNNDLGLSASNAQYGLDPSKISSNTVYGKWQGSPGVARADMGKDPDITTQTYNGPGGQFQQKGGGQWTDSFGNPIQDLGQYSKSKELQATGSDFSDYENQLRGLMSDPSKIQQTAGSQFAQRQGEQAINRSAAARGQLGGGGVLAELAKYGQGMASQDYGDQVNRLSSLIGQKQQFGLGTGYFNPKQYLNPLDINRSESKNWSWGWSGKM